MRSAIIVVLMVIVSVYTACPARVTFYSARANENQAQKELMSKVDHIIYGTTDLDRGVAEIEKLTGVRAEFGGRHPGRGTRNALLVLGPTSYLEIIASDPDQPAPREPRSFGIDGLKESKLVGWAAKGRNLEQFVAEAKRKGIAFGAVRDGSRKRPDGVVLSWTTADVKAEFAEGLVPFLID